MGRQLAERQCSLRSARRSRRSVRLDSGYGEFRDVEKQLRTLHESLVGTAALESVEPEFRARIDGAIGSVLSRNGPSDNQGRLSLGDVPESRHLVLAELLQPNLFRITNRAEEPGKARVDPRVAVSIHASRRKW